MSIGSVVPSNHLILCCPLLLPFPASGSFPVSQPFTSGGQSTGASASARYSGLNSFRIDWLDFLAVQGTLKSFLQFESSKSLVFNLLYCPTLTSIHDFWKNHSFDYMDLRQQSDVSAFNMLSRFVIAFLSRSKHLLISWLQSEFTVILGVQKNKVCYCFHFYPIYMPWSKGTRLPWSYLFECWLLR